MVINSPRHLIKTKMSPTNITACEKLKNNKKNKNKKKKKHLSILFSKNNPENCVVKTQFNSKTICKQSKKTMQQKPLQHCLRKSPQVNSSKMIANKLFLYLFFIFIFYIFFLRIPPTTGFWDIY